MHQAACRTIPGGGTLIKQGSGTLIPVLPAKGHTLFQNVLSVHGILLFAELVDQGVSVKVDHIICDELAQAIAGLDTFAAP